MNNDNIRIANKSDALTELEGLIEYSSIIYEISDEAAEYVLSILKALKNAIDKGIV